MYMYSRQSYMYMKYKICISKSVLFRPSSIIFFNTKYMVIIKSCRYTLLTIRLPMTWLQHVQMKQLTILVKLGVRPPIVIVMCLMEYWVNHQK